MRALRIAASIVAAFAIVTLCAAFVLWRSRLEISRTWKPVEVQVIRNWMETRQAGAADEESTSYSAHYELAYTINGRSIRAPALSEDVFVGGPEPVQMRLSRHAAGTHGVAYVNLNNPNQVRLNLGNNANVFALPLWLLLAGAFQLLIGLSLWFMGTPTVFW